MNLVKKAGCILINMKEKKIALVLRKGDYSFPKGHLEEMETIKDCAKREAIEETGHEVEILGEEISIIRYKSSEGEDVENHFFIGIDTGRTNKKIAEKDKEKTEWFEIDKVEERLAYQNLKDTWKEIKPKIEKIVNELQLDIIISKLDKYYYSYIKIKDESYIPTNIYYIEDLNLDTMEQYNFNNHIIYFLCNLSLNNKVISVLKNKNCYFINKSFFLHDYTKLEVQQILNKNNIDIPEIVTINGLNKIQYPVFCKENSHVGINLIAYSENTLVKFFCKFNMSDFYCEKIITGGKEMKLYCINNIVYDNNKVIKNKELKELIRIITNSLQIETFSADIINKGNKNIVIDINPNSGFFSSNIARKNFLKYIINCSNDIINNVWLNRKGPEEITNYDRIISEQKVRLLENKMTEKKIRLGFEVPNLELKPYKNGNQDEIQFIYNLKKEVYKEYVEKYFGDWNEENQKKLFERFMKENVKSIELIYIKDELVGFYHGKDNNDVYEIGNICVKPEYQNKGIGTAVLKEILFEHKGQNIKLQVFKINEKAVKLYKKMGFEKVEETETHYIMIKN